MRDARTRGRLSLGVATAVAIHVENSEVKLLRFPRDCVTYVAMEATLLTAAPHPATAIFQRILDAPIGLIALEGGDCAALIAQFRHIARLSGQSVYLWQRDIGLANLRETHARVPGCQRLGAALRYMQQSMHFGIYLLEGLQLPLSAMDSNLLRQLSRLPSGHVRRVVMLDAPAALADQFGESILRLSGRLDLPQRPRLRDGRWLTCA